MIYTCTSNRIYKVEQNRNTTMQMARANNEQQNHTNIMIEGHIIKILKTSLGVSMHFIDERV